jgi:signal transduction histidine kinase
MFAIGKLENKLVILLLSFLFIIVIGILDYFTSAELTLSIFYLIPIALHALYKSTNKTLVLVNSLFASLTWALVMFEAKFYSHIFYNIWNGVVMFTFFSVIGLLILFLVKKIKELKDTNENKNILLGIAAHDLRSPISVINSFSDLLLSDYSEHLNPRSSRIINFIKETSNNALILLKNLLDISIIESGKIKIVLKEQDYLDFLKKNISLNQIIADKKVILLKLETLENEINLNFDEYYLSEVTNNLLTNAMKYSYPKSEILVKVTKTDSKSVLTQVIDKGKGIPENEQNKLFNYFQKTSISPTAGEKSTGLGLAIAKKIILEHGGQIGLTSTIDVGSNFYYELKLANHTKLSLEN